MLSYVFLNKLCIFAKYMGDFMGLDIYAGTLTRYYTKNWKTVVQQWADKNGYTFHRITPDGDTLLVEGEISAIVVQKEIENWRDQILAALLQSGQKAYIPWPEDNEKPYFTDKPDWDAFGAMLLVAACCSYGEPVPATIPKDWRFSEHPLIVQLSEDKEKIWSLFRGAICWLPLSDSFMFQAPLPTGEQTMISTTAGLRKELEKLNALAWQADEGMIYDWSYTEGYPVEEKEGVDGIFSKADIPEHTQYDTQSLAKFSFSIFYQALKFSEKNKVPIVLDY